MDALQNSETNTPGSTGEVAKAQPTRKPSDPVDVKFICDNCSKGWIKQIPLLFSIGLTHEQSFKTCPECIDAFAEELEEKRLEQERIAKLTPEERKAELAEMARDERECDNQEAVEKNCGYKYSDTDFETFVPKSKSQQIALDACRAYVPQKARAYRSVRGWLYLYGPPGRGKTHLAVSIFRAIVESYDNNSYKHVVRFTTMTDMLAGIREEMSNEGSSEVEAIRNLAGIHLLILDDLGAEKTTSWAMQTLYTVIAGRERNRLPTVITSNLSLGEIEARIGDNRIISRIIGAAQILRLDGDDYRIANRRKP